MGNINYVIAKGTISHHTLSLDFAHMII
jgi:hypothetical protein